MIVAQVRVALGEIVLMLPGQVLVPGREAIGGVLAGHVAQGPEHILQVLRRAAKLSPPRTTRTNGQPLNGSMKL
jgi:hypothetical protein